MIEIGAGTRISPLADLEDSTRGTAIVLGPDCVVDAFVKIKPVGGRGDVIIGARCYLNSGVVIYSGNGVRMGDDVLVAANCTLAPVNHEFGSRDQPISAQGFAPGRGGIVIEDDVWLGANCVVLDGAHIERGAVVGAGAVVAGRLEAYGVFRGAPAVRVGRRG